MTALVDLPRRLLASDAARLLALCALAATVVVAASLPQGWAADSYLRAPYPGPLKDWAAWGLTNLADQPLFWALVTLFVGTAALSALRGAGPRRDRDAAPHHALKAHAARPEDAPETVAAALRAHLGEPDRAEWDGRQTRLTYRLGPRPGDGLRTALGLAVVFVAGVYVLQPPPEERTVARAWLGVEEVGSGLHGTFDIVQGEEFTFFQSPDVYVLRGYVADRMGLGPALRFQWSDPQGERFGSFWLYENAPAGFDRRHRQASIALDVLRARQEPVPGAGATSRPASWGLILGLGLLMVGAAARMQPTVDAAVVCTGHDVRVELFAPEGAGRERLWRRLRAAVEEEFPVSTAS
jgi:hypothetical protein